MSRLSEREQEGCRKLLSFLSYSDLTALCDTVTNKSIPVRNTAEAMNAILTHSQSAEELLKRRKVHREVIFKYLISEGVDMSPEPDKNQLTRMALLFWSSNSTVESNNQSHQPGGSTDVPMARGSTTRRGIRYRRDRRQDRRHLRHHGPSLQPNQNQQYRYRLGGHLRQGQQQDLKRESVYRISGTPESSRVFSVNETINIGRTFRIGEAHDTSRTNR